MGSSRLASRQDVAEIYRAANGEWAWRMKAPNGEIIAGGSGETYNNHGDLERLIVKHFGDVHIVTLDDPDMGADQE